MTSPPPIVVLASGDGTNLQALIDAVHGADALIAGVGSNVAGCRALDRAAAAGIPTATFPVADYADRSARDDAMAAWIASLGAQVVVLAGYMALVSSGFVSRFSGQIVNVHPSLLPAFPGLRAIEQAIEYGVKIVGVTVHLVDDGVDTGPVLLQAAIDMPEPPDRDTVHAALRPLEHRLLVQAVRGLLAGRYSRAQR